MNITLLIGSLKATSINKKLSGTIKSISPKDIVFSTPSLDLPLFNEDLENNPPTSVINLKDSLKSADGIIIISPEYNRSFSGVLKNAIDWASRPYGNNSIKNKPVAITGITHGQIGTALAQSAIKAPLIFLEAKIMTQPELYLTYSKVFDENGNLLESSKPYLERFIKSFTEFVKVQNS